MTDTDYYLEYVIATLSDGYNNHPTSNYTEKQQAIYHLSRSCSFLQNYTDGQNMDIPWTNEVATKSAAEDYYRNNYAIESTELKNNSSPTNCGEVKYNSQLYMKIGPFNWSVPAALSIVITDQTGNAVPGLLYGSYDGNRLVIDADGNSVIKNNVNFYMLVPTNNKATSLNIHVSTTVTISTLRSTIWLLTASADPEDHTLSTNKEYGTQTLISVDGGNSTRTISAHLDINRNTFSWKLWNTKSK